MTAIVTDEDPRHHAAPTRQYEVAGRPPTQGTGIRRPCSSPRGGPRREARQPTPAW
jgi:hypothetical protein